MEFPAIGSLWRRRNGREVLRIARAWYWGGDDTDPVVRGHPVRGGRPVVIGVPDLKQIYEEAS